MRLRAQLVAALMGLSLGILTGGTGIVSHSAWGFGGNPPPDDCQEQYECKEDNTGQDCTSAGQKCQDDPYCVCEQARQGGCDCVLPER